jgi:ABC-type lipoprotein release transport system permease subunit
MIFDPFNKHNNFKYDLKCIAILIKNNIFFKSKDFFHHAIYRCWATIFVISFITISIDSITRGIYRENLSFLKFIHSDIRISIDQSLNSKKINNLKQLIEENCENKIKFISKIGIKEAFILINNKIYPIVLAILDDNFDNIFPNIKLNNIYKNGAYFGINFYKKYNLKKNDIGILLLDGFLDKNKFKIDFKKIPIIIEGFFKIGFDDWDNQTIILNKKYYEKFFKTTPFNYFCIKIKNDFIFDLNKIKNNLEKKKFYGVKSVTLSGDLFPGFYDSLKIEFYCSLLVCLLLILMGSYYLYNLLYIFFIYKLKDFAAHLIRGVSKKKLFFVSFFISSFSLSIFSFFGSIIAFFTLKIFDTYKFLKLNGFSFGYIPFEPSLKICLLIVFLNILISLLTIKKIFKKLNNFDLYKIITK